MPSSPGNQKLAANGGYTYSVANADVHFLAGSRATGCTLFPYTTLFRSAADGTSQLVSFTIHGTNDAAVIGTPTVADVTEDTPSNATVTLTAVGSISIKIGRAHD